MREVEWPYGWGRVPYTYEDRKPWMHLPFSLAEYESRIDRVRALLEREGLDALLVHGIKGADRAGVRYLSNFEDYYTGDSFVLVPVDGDVAFATNAIMHSEPMHSGIQEVWMRDVRAAPHPRTVDYETTTLDDHVKDLIGERKLSESRIGVAGFYTDGTKAFLRQEFPKITQVEATWILGEAMAKKTEAEVELMRKVARMSDAAMEALLRAAVPGATEHDLAAEANYAMFKAGAETTAFPLSACAGPRSGFKHAGPTDRVLQAGEIAFTDLGGQLGGYCSDTARATVVGGAATDEQRRFLDAQIAIVDETVAMMGPGVKIGDIAQVAEDMAKGFGFEQWFYFRGHGIGAHTHIPPSFVPGSEVVLEPNMTFAYEPMIVRKDFGTACNEDIYVITDDGCERLSELPMRWWD